MGRIPSTCGANNDAADGALVERVQIGEMGALGELYGRYSVTVQKAVLRTMPSITDADKEDLVHDIFLSLLSMLANYDRSRAFRPWLYGVAVKTTQNFKRKHNVRALLLRQRALENERTRVPPAEGDRIERAQLLHRGLSQLPKGQKDVLILHAVEGFKGDEIAQILEIETNTVWSRLHRAHKALKLLLEDQCEGAGGNDNGV